MIISTNTIFTTTKIQRLATLDRETRKAEKRKREEEERRRIFELEEEKKRRDEERKRAIEVSLVSPVLV